MRQQTGFSLIELLIVVAIILILAAIAIPGLMQARIAANESSAVASLRVYNTTQSTYQSTYPTVGYAGTFAQLGPPAGGNPVSSAAAGLLDNTLGCAQTICKKSGYYFQLAANGTPAMAFSIQANPQITGSTGSRYFFTDNTHVTRVNLTTYAGPDDAVLSK